MLLCVYLTNRFHVAVRLFSNRAQRTSKCGTNISDPLCCASCATSLFLPHFDVICDLITERQPRSQGTRLTERTHGQPRSQGPFSNSK